MTVEITFAGSMSKKARWEMGMMQTCKSTPAHIEKKTLYFKIDEGKLLQNLAEFYSSYY